MIEHVPWWSPLVGYALGWLMGRLDRETQGDPRRRINHENRRGTGPSGARPRVWSQVSRRLPPPRWEDRVTPSGTKISPEEKIRNLTDRVQRLEEAVLNGGARG